MVDAAVAEMPAAVTGRTPKGKGAAGASGTREPGRKNYSGPDNSSMSVVLRTRPSGGFVTYVEHRPGPGQKGMKTGMREVHTSEPAAQRKFKALCKQAEELGWTPRADNPPSFTEMPTPGVAKK